MEKFSAYRDPGTGIQPFLTPVPPLAPDLLQKITLPLRYVLGAIRTLLVLLLLFVYLVLVQGLCLVLAPIPPLHRAITRLFTAVISRAALLVVGLLWIPVEQVNRKRGRGPKAKEAWNPRAGDVIVSNWVSWIELLWLAFRFNPIFVVPISDGVRTNTNIPPLSSPITHTPGRRTGTGSANVQPTSRPATARTPIVGFRQFSLLSMIRGTGYVPLSGAARSLEDIRKNAKRPIVVFPECTTSNGRGILRFSDVFRQKIPVKAYQVFVMCVRYDPPTVLTPTLTRSIPGTILNPLPHLFALTCSLTPLTMSIRLLAPSESPSSQLFMASEVLSDPHREDELAEACAALIAQIGKMKRIGMGWEDKTSFLDFYWGKRK